MRWCSWCLVKRWWFHRFLCPGRSVTLIRLSVTYIPKHCLPQPNVVKSIQRSFSQKTDQVGNSVASLLRPWTVYKHKSRCIRFCPLTLVYAPIKWYKTCAQLILPQKQGPGSKFDGVTFTFHELCLFININIDQFFVSILFF